MLLRPKKCYIFKNIYLFLCLKVISDTLGSFWLKNSSDFGKVQFCPELSNFSRFYPILATGEDFSTIVRLFYKPCQVHRPSMRADHATKCGPDFWTLDIRMFHQTTICWGDNYTGKNFVPPIKTRSPVVKAVKLMAWRQAKSPLKITTWSGGQRSASHIF